VIYVHIFENKQHVNIFLPSIAYLKCTPSDKQMYPQGCIHPRLETPALDGSSLLKFLLETRLKSESFETLDDLLRFLVKVLT